MKAKVAEQKLSQLRLEGEKLNSKGECGKFVYHCDVMEVLPWVDEAMEPLPKKSIVGLNDGEKRFMIKQIWGNCKGSLAGTFPKKMLGDEDLKATAEYLAWQYQQPLVNMASPAAVKVAMVEGTSTMEGQLCILEVKELMQRSKYVVVPIHSNEPLHWTALVLGMEGDAGASEVKKVWYFDWCSACIPSNRVYARKILRLLTIADTHFLQLPARANKFVQANGSNDCGLVVWYALEMCMKNMRMEGEWTLYPQPGAWRIQLHTFKNSLLKEQSKWMAEDAKLQNKKWKPKFLIQIPGAKVLEKAVQAHLIADAMEKGKCKHKAKDFFTCSSCRWSSSGDGCYKCNPAKTAEVKERREKEALQVKAAVEKFYELAAAQGILVEHVPEDKVLEEKGGKMEGGGMAPSTASQNL